ncbi:MAG TPA: hypothetical protein VE173_10970, partial [Longimicrobiales bacterium]|nr:hypothetical protein [Longimicrobiales bacterium]
MTDEPAARRRLLLALAAAVVAVQVALVLTTFIPAPHNGGDNAGYITLARSLLEGRYVDLWDPTTPPHTKYPPVFPAVLAVWIAAGAATWTALKSVPALFTVLSVVLAYLWAARRRGPLFGAAVALLFGVSRAVLWSSHWILSDPTFVALT